MFLVCHVYQQWKHRAKQDTKFTTNKRFHRIFVLKKTLGLQLLTHPTPFDFEYIFCTQISRSLWKRLHLSAGIMTQKVKPTFVMYTRAQKIAQLTGPQPPTWKTQVEFPAPGFFSLAWTYLLSHLRNDSVNRGCLSHPHHLQILLPFSMSFCFSNK